MARGVAFRYLPGGSLLHRWDARCKLIALCVVTTMLVHGVGAVLCLFSGLLLAAMWAANLRCRLLLRDLRGWVVLLIVVFAAQAVDTQEQAIRVAPWAPVSRESLDAALLSIWRLALILAYSTLFSMVTRARDVQQALLWVLRPFPFLPARRIALMMGLVMRFLPLTLDAVEEVRLANRSRLGDQVRNPLKRIKHLAVPVMRRALGRADELTVALVARGYREDLKPFIPPIPLTHVAPLAVLLLVASLAEGISGLLLSGSQQGMDLLFHFLQRS
ncbi:MAG: energy-coupling factor transporter transmembrane protein EcfT [Syntrophobacteraceae bacterium]